jgi:hypothetical protein
MAEFARSKARGVPADQKESCTPVVKKRSVVRLPELAPLSQIWEYLEQRFAVLLGSERVPLASCDAPVIPSMSLLECMNDG